jgi:hypothetical protein
VVHPLDAGADEAVVKLRSIISGGQTGADRGALDAARDVGLHRGGWAPLGWRAEDGMIPIEYRDGMQESASAAYPVRTRQNIEASDGTLVVSLGELTADSGSMLTSKLARKLGKPCLALTVDRLELSVGRAIVRGWLEGASIVTLNVAGPRESREPGIQAATRAVLAKMIAEWWAADVRLKALHALTDHR